MDEDKDKKFYLIYPVIPVNLYFPALRSNFTFFERQNYFDGRSRTCLGFD